jgi:hypothetical protein
VEIDGEVSGAGFVTRRLDVADGSPGREIWYVLRYVRPVLAAITR